MIKQVKDILYHSPPYSPLKRRRPMGFLIMGLVQSQTHHQAPYPEPSKNPVVGKRRRRRHPGDHGGRPFEVLAVPTSSNEDSTNPSSFSLHLRLERLGFYQKVRISTLRYAGGKAGRGAVGPLLGHGGEQRGDCAGGERAGGFAGSEVPEQGSEGGGDTGVQAAAVLRDQTGGAEAQGQGGGEEE